MARQWRALVLGFPSSDRGAVLCGGATGEASRSRASSVLSRRVTCAPCALLSAAHDTEPVFGSQPRAMRERAAGLKGGRCHGKHDPPSCFALGARFPWLRGCGRDLKQNRERRRIRLFLYVAGRRPGANATHRPASEATPTAVPCRSLPRIPAFRSLIARGCEPKIGSVS